MAEKIFRYMGVKPFDAVNRNIFFGRDEDIEGLFTLILAEKSVVLFGKSGYGKSSLLNAGVLPLFQEEAELARRAIVIEARFGAYTKTQARSPLKIVLAKLQEKLPDQTLSEKERYLNDLFPSETDRPLWYHIKRRQSAIEGGRFVMVFDQFEEFFSYPISDQDQFKRELAELLYSDIPQYLRKHLGELTLEAKRQLAQPMNIKAVFAIRSDRISLLDSMTDALPAILHKRYELRSLSSMQARDAITKPAKLNGANFVTPPFEFTEPAIQKIITELSSSQNKGVEAFQLQILCQYIENLIETQSVPDRDGNGLPDVDTGDLPDLSNLYETYYRRQLDRLAEAQQRPAQVVLEEGLIAEDSQSGEGRRMSVDSQFLKNQFSVDDELLRALENTYLVRKEPNSVGGDSLEISHDTLVTPILKIKKERRAREELVEAKRRENEAKRIAQKEQWRRQLATLLSGAAILGLVVAGYQYFKAKEASLIADKAKTEAENQRNAATTALQKVISARKEKLKGQIMVDEKADFLESARKTRFFLSKIDSLEKSNTSPDIILSEIEVYITNSEQ